MEDIKYNSTETILKTLRAEDLPVYTSWDNTRFYRVRHVDGRTVCDRLNIKDGEYCQSILDVCLDKTHKRINEEDWNNAVHKLMKYIR